MCVDSLIDYNLNWGLSIFCHISISNSMLIILMCCLIDDKNKKIKLNLWPCLSIVALKKKYMKINTAFFIINKLVTVMYTVVGCEVYT